MPTSFLTSWRYLIEISDVSFSPQPKTLLILLVEHVRSALQLLLPLVSPMLEQVEVVLVSSFQLRPLLNQDLILGFWVFHS